MGETERRGGRRPAGWHPPLRCVRVCVAALLAVGGVNAMTIEVEDGSNDCVFINAKKGSTINANYEVCGTSALHAAPLARRMLSR